MIIKSYQDSEAETRRAVKDKSFKKTGGKKKGDKDKDKDKEKN